MKKRLPVTPSRRKSVYHQCINKDKENIQDILKSLKPKKEEQYEKK
jgi:hypothetical protein